MRSLEIEVKVRIEGPEEARRMLRSAGAVETRSRHFEDNLVFDTPAGDLAARGALLRVREAGDGRAALTYKEKAGADLRAKVRREWEVEVSSAAILASILERAGLVRAYRYQKFRTVFTLAGATLDLDETPMGCFLEIEGTSEGILEAGARLGVREQDHLIEDYRVLFHRWLEARGLPPGDMVFEGGGGPGREGR